MSEPRKPYSLQAADRCGVFRESRFATFADLLTTLRRWERERGTDDWIAQAHNLDHADWGFDGLTDDEAAAFESVPRGPECRMCADTGRIEVQAWDGGIDEGACRECNPGDIEHTYDDDYSYEDAWREAVG